MGDSIERKAERIRMENKAKAANTPGKKVAAVVAAVAKKATGK